MMDGYKGHADGMVSGAAHTTQHTILPALQFIKTKPNSSVVSSIFYVLRRPSFCFW
jgi:phosphate acetyltransferase